MGQKIFFTEGGRTNKVIKYYSIFQNSKQLLETAALKKRSKEEEVNK